LGQRGVSAAEGLAGLEHSLPQIAPKAKRVIYISLIGAPSQLDLFDYKPDLKKRFKEDLKTWLKGQGERLTGVEPAKVLKELFALVTSSYPDMTMCSLS
jgi:hypothetical protein